MGKSARNLASSTWVQCFSCGPSLGNLRSSELLHYLDLGLATIVQLTTFCSMYMSMFPPGLLAY